MSRGKYHQMHEKHGDPAMRPSVEALRSKLRKMSMLQDQPDAVVFIINDMMRYYFVDQQSRPWELHRLAGIALLQLQIVLGIRLEEEFVDDQLPLGLLPDNPIVADPGNGLSDPDGSADSAGDSPPFDWNDFFLMHRIGAQKIIEDHVPNFIGGMRLRCRCGRIYEDQPAWAYHARVRMWRYLMNDFKADD